MDVREKVQQTRPDVEGAEARLGVARARLTSEIAAGDISRSTRPAAPQRILAGVLIGAAVIATACVLAITGLTTQPEPVMEAVPTREPGPTLQPSSTPVPTQEPMTSAAVFGAAATAARSFSGLTLAPGQYLRVHTQTEQIVYHQPDPDGGQYQADRSNAQNAWRGTSSWDSYAPADPGQQWFFAPDQPWTVTDTFGPDAAVLSQAHAEGMSSSGDPYFADAPSAPWATPDGYGLAAFFSAMPTDPAALIAWIRENQGIVTGDQDYKVGWVLIELLAYNMGSSDQRATMYDALSMLAGSEIVASDATSATLRFSATTDALSGQPAVQRRSITIDTTTGLVSETTAVLDVASGLIPASLPDERHVYTVSVVDSLP